MVKQEIIKLEQKQGNMNLTVGAEFLIFGTDNIVPTLNFTRCHRIESFGLSQEELFCNIIGFLEDKNTGDKGYNKVEKNIRWVDYMEGREEALSPNKILDYVFSAFVNEKIVAFWDSKTSYLYYEPVSQ